jgi:hypothetical protein
MVHNCALTVTVFCYYPHTSWTLAYALDFYIFLFSVAAVVFQIHLPCRPSHSSPSNLPQLPKSEIGNHTLPACKHVANASFLRTGGPCVGAVYKRLGFCLLFLNYTFVPLSLRHFTILFDKFVSRPQSIRLEKQ